MAGPLHESTIAHGTLRPTHVEVDLDAIATNLQRVRDAVGVPVMPILKANAYGHGLVRVAQLMEQLGAPFIGLAYLEEALRLRECGVQTPILVLGGIVGGQIPLFIDHDLILTASSVDKLYAIDACASSMGRIATVHLKIDTGMERIGVHWYSAEPLLQASLNCPHVHVQGVFSHLANSDAADLTHARLQLERFDEVLAFYDRHSLATPLRHMANSGAVLQLPEARYDLVRPGIMLFGVMPDPALVGHMELRPALSWKSQVVYFKVVKPGSMVSYGSTWTADRLTRLLTVPVGYGDGYLRAMVDSAQVLVGGQRYPVRGRICMDQLMVDIGWDSAYNGDEVVLIGSDGDQSIRVEDLAAWAGTISYEVLTNINTRVPRVYVNAPPS